MSPPQLLRGHLERHFSGSFFWDRLWGGPFWGTPGGLEIGDFAPKKEKNVAFCKKMSKPPPPGKTRKSAKMGVFGVLSSRVSMSGTFYRKKNAHFGFSQFWAR